jgi:hypothetical protein
MLGFQRFKAKALHRLDPPVVALPRHLIARQVGVDTKKNLLGLWSFWVVVFLYLFGKCRWSCFSHHLVRLLLFGSLTSTMASTELCSLDRRMDFFSLR